MADATSDRASGGGGEETLVRTFLLADVRGYTRYTAEHGDDAASALARRLAGLVGTTVPEFGGELLEVRGDETLCVFSSARQALRAAVELQRRLRAPAQSEPFPLAVGMGLDAGEATPTDGGYRGAALNMAGRLVSAAGPGEVLATERLVRLSGQLDGLHWSRPRTMRLKGLADPELIVRVEADEPLPAPPSAPRQPSTSHRKAVVAAGCALAAVGAIVFVVLSSRGSRTDVPVRSNSVAAVSPSTGRVVADVAIRGEPGPLIAAFRRVWIGEPKAQTLAWFNPMQGKVRSVGVSSPPTSLAATPSAVLTYDGSSGSGSEIDPGKPQPIPFSVPNPPCGGLSSAGFCNGGGLTTHARWVWASTINSQTVWKVSANSLARHGKPTRNVFGDVLTYGLGSVWAYGDRQSYVYQIDPNNGRLLHRYNAGGAGLIGPAPIVTADGQVWVLHGATITVIDPTNPSLPANVTVHPGLSAATATATDLWVTTNDGRVYRVSLFTKQAKLIAKLGHAATGVTVADSTVWVSVGQ